MYQIRKMNLTYYKGIIFKKFGEKRLYSFEKNLKDLLEYSAPKTCKNLDVPVCHNEIRLALA